MDIIKAYAVKNLCYIAAKKMRPKGIVVHSTGANNPNLKRYVDCPDKVGRNTYGNHWNVPKPDGVKKCVHAFIGYDNNNIVSVAEILPLDICCWGVGKGKKGSYNTNPAYIQFEICEDGLKDKTYYEKAFNVAAQYCAQLCRNYNISLDSIVGHCEAYKKGYGSNHSDPEHWMKKFDENMDKFREKVRQKLNVNEEESTNTSNISDNSIRDGMLVSISSDATYYNGKMIPDWVKTQNWYVKGQPVGDRVVIDKNQDGTNSICSAISSRYLTEITKTETFKCDYKVKVTANSLNIREGASAYTAKVGCITDNGVYTIVEESVGKGATLWGKLKSGVGWISLDYVKKI